MKPSAKTALLLLLIPAVFAAGCKEQEEIQNVPTPRGDTQTYILRQTWPEPEHTIEVAGSGEVITDPDFATIRVGVSVTGDTAESASAQCQERLQLIYEAALGFQVARADISSAGIEIEARRNEEGGEIVDFLASDTVTVIVRDVDDLNTVLTTVIDAGASQIYAVTYGVTEASTAYREALAAAVADAHEKAAVLAEASGASLGRVAGIVEQPYDESKLVGVDFESSSIVVTADVVVTFLID